MLLLFFVGLSRPHLTSKKFFFRIFETYFIFKGLTLLHVVMSGGSWCQASPP